ncbi:MAG TPA: Holliday junction branch migration protein RuvA [Firmicutes bacterium]|nr:Holliday junction branch migration protein RuvA [Bacillota bacterium]
MLYSLRGKLIYAQPKLAVIECGGVGFRCQITMTTARQLPSVGAEAMLYTIMSVREDAIELFGFAGQAELECFKQLTAVTGVGPKAGLAILSELSPEKVALAAASGDYKAFTRAQGVGPKLAQRIVLELKDKFGALAASGGVELPGGGGGIPSAAGNAAEAVSALSVLGFTPSEAAAAVGKLDSALPVETLVREALKSLAKKG